MIGQKVKLTKNMAQWYLEHPEIFEVKGSIPEKDFKEFGTLMQSCMYVVLGGEVIGKVIKPGVDSKTWCVKFSGPFGKHWAYYEYPKDIMKVK